MNTDFPKIKAFMVAAGIFLLMSVITVFVWHYSQNAQKKSAQGDFSSANQQLQTSIQNRLILYMNAIDSANALFSASSFGVARNEFHNYFRSYNIFQDYPGINGISFIQAVPDSQKQAFIKSVQKDTSITPGGYPNFDIHPAGTHPEYYVLLYSEPNETGIGTSTNFGLDFGTDPDRGPAITAARDSGSFFTTQPTELLNSLNQRAFLIFDPIYQNGLPINTVSERQAAFQGVIAGVFSANTFFTNLEKQGTFNTGLDYIVYDGTDLTSDNLIYANHGTWTSGQTGNFYNTLSLNAPGRNWHVLVRAPADFELTPTERLIPYLILIVGFVFSLLMFFLVYFMASSRSRAVALATQMTLKLEESQRLFKLSIDNAGDMIFISDLAGKFIETNRQTSEALGYTREELAKLSVGDIDTQWNNERVRKSVSTLLPGTPMRIESIQKRKDGSTFPVEVNVTKFESAGHPLVLAVARDISVRKQAENKLKERTQESERLNKIMVDREIKMMELKDEIAHLKAKEKNQ